MTDVILINPPLTTQERYGEFSGVGTELPNLGLAYLAAYVREKGMKVRIIDAPARGLFDDAIAQIVAEEKPVIAGLTATTVALSKAARCAKAIRTAAPETKIIIGGPHVTSMPHQTMTDHTIFDAGVIGEGENTLVELARSFADRRGPENIPGIIHRSKEGLVVTEPVELIADLDALPMPAWDLLPDLASTYKPSPQSAFGLPATILFTTRGCPFRCTFCDRSVFGGKVRSHSAGRVFEMMEHLHHRYGIVHFNFHDESFIFKEGRLREICNRIIDSKLPLTWVCQGRVDQPVSDETLRLMKKAGCRQLQFGIETANDELLKIMKKGTTVPQIHLALERTKAAGISTKAFFMVGLFGETISTMKNSERFMLEAPLDDVMISFFTPFPGCEAHEEIRKYGELIGDYEKMNEYEVVFLPKGLTAERIFQARKAMYRRFYFRPRIVWNYLLRLRRPSLLLEMLRSFFATIKALIS